MKVRANRETDFLLPSSKGVFVLDFNECKKLSQNEKDLLIEAYVQPAVDDKSAKLKLIKFATTASNNGEITLKQIANKKNAPIEKISHVFRNAIDKSDKVLRNVANGIIDIINASLTVKNNFESFKEEVFFKEGKEFIYAISLLCDVLLRKNIIWFLKIAGYPPTNKQIDIINSFFSKCEEEERITANIQTLIKESISPLNNMIEGNKDSIEELKDKATKLEDAIQVLNIRRQQLSSKISEIEKKIDIEISQQSYSDNFEAKITELDKKSTEQYNELSDKIIDINVIKEHIDNAIEPIDSRLSELSHNADNIGNSLSAMILKNKNSFLTDNKELMELKGIVDIIQQEIENIKKKVNSNNSFEINNNLYIEKGEKLSGNIEICESIEIFEDLLNDNLKKYCNVSSEYIASILCSDTIPLFCGFNAREVATIVSVSLCGELPYIISVPHDYNDVGSIVDICKSTDTGVILFEDILGSMNERLIFALLRSYRNNISKYRNKKISVPYIFMSCESANDFKLLPISIFNHVTVIQCPDHIKGFDVNELDLGSAEKILCPNKNSSSNKDVRQFKMNIINSSLPDIYYQIKSDIISNFNNGITTLIENEIKYIVPNEEVKVFQNV